MRGIRRRSYSQAGDVRKKRGRPSRRRIASFRREVLGFVVSFGVLLATFCFILQTQFVHDTVFQAHLHQTAAMCGTILAIMGVKYKIVETSLFSPDFSLILSYGCDSIYPTAMLWSAMLAFSAPWRLKLLGLVIGAILLYSLNVLRVVCLHYVGAYFPSFFDMVHIYAWQSLFILLTLAIFLLWVARVSRLRMINERKKPTTSIELR